MKNIIIIVLTVLSLNSFAQQSDKHTFEELEKQDLIYSNSVIELTLKNFDGYMNEGVTLVYFWADWCKFCKNVAPSIERLAQEIGDKVHICKSDVNKTKKKAQQLKVQNIPTVIIFKNGTIVKKIVGVHTYKKYLKEIKNVL